MVDERLEQLAVRIENTSGNSLGSGVIWVPQIETQYAYIFTAAHVVSQGDIVIRCLNDCSTHGKILTYNNQGDINCHANYSKENDVLNNDVAVIRISKEEWMVNLPKLVFGKPIRNMEVCGRGFPLNARDGAFLMAGQMLEGSIGNCVKEIKRFQIQLNMSRLNQANRSGELSGYSGTGLFQQSDCQDELALLGIFSYGQGVDAALGTTNAFSVDLIKETCENYGWDIPEYSNDAPVSFEPYIQEAVGILSTERIKNEIYESACDLVADDLTPTSLIENLKDCHDIPKCKSNRLRCKRYWIARLQLLSIIRTTGTPVETSQGLSLRIVQADNETNLPIEFICSEGHDGKCSIENFIRSLVISEYTRGRVLRDNGIVIWASDEVPTKKMYKKSKFSNIVKDICFETSGESRRYKLNIKYGESTPNNLAVIHIHKLLESIDDIDSDNCPSSGIKNCVEELFVDAITG